MLTARHLTASLSGRIVLDDIGFSLTAGTLIGLIGPNGAGKTTLLRALAGLLPPGSGAVSLDERPLAAWPRRMLARNLAYLAQDAPCSWPLPVRRIVALGRLPYLQPWQRPSRADEHAIEDALQQADVLPLAERNILTLSGGERARVMLARALAAGPRFLLADEPIAGLDPAHQLHVMALLRSRAQAGLGLVVTLHDLGLAARFCERIIVIAEGRIAADGTPRRVLTPATLAGVFGIQATFGRRDDQPFIVPWEVVPRLRVVAGRKDRDGRRT